ncbi:MAG TPA: ion transporter [Ginsengibacter sp.]|nr:ion transporter [Ginsengibacter sp.]HRP18860.1 ion transporter [Ginsengibacter sp.]
MEKPEKIIFGKPVGEWKILLNKLFFGGKSKEGTQFDLWLLGVILFSVIIILLISVPSIEKKYGLILSILEWFFTIVFTIEYFLRIWVSKEKVKYVTSFYGLVDFVSIFPAYLGFLDFSFRALLILRSLRLLRIFKILRLRAFLSEAQYIRKALLHSYRKILIFMMFISLLVIIIGSIMYIVEEGTPGFESIPDSIYWAAVTITTVGYGDVAPMTPLGKFLSIVVMLCGYSIIAVPTGIVTAEMARNQMNTQPNDKKCPACGYSRLAATAHFCSNCGESLTPPKENQA